MTLPRVTDSGSLAQQVAASISRQQSVQLMPGRVVNVTSAGAVTVNVDGVRLDALSLPGGVPLVVGDAVTVLRQGGTYRVIGLVATATPPLTGTVQSVPFDSDSIIVSTALGNLALPWLGTYTPAVGDSVWIAPFGSTLVVLGKKGQTGSPPPPPPPPSPTGGGGSPAPPPPQQRVITGTSYFPATGSGTFRGGEWLGNGISNGNVMQGSYGFGAASGAWFYSGRPHSTLAGATVTGAKIWLRRVQGGVYAAQTIHLCRVSQNKRPSGGLSFDGGHATDSIRLAVGQYGWFNLPVSIAQALVDSGGSLGVTSDDPYVRLAGKPNNSGAGELRITWRRAS